MNAARPAASGSAESATVLVVDDDAHTLASLRLLLADDYRVLEAESVPAAERILERDEVDVVLTDYEMPLGTGLLLLERMRARHARVIGILMTAHAWYPEVVAASGAGKVFQVMAKPLDPDAVVGAVRHAAHLARIRQSVSRLPRSGCAR
ncbi:MAG TPA: response regulator [Minicystis sp.]|nr:response regulator [Minicystis sp.]